MVFRAHPARPARRPIVAVVRPPPTSAQGRCLRACRKGCGLNRGGARHARVVAPASWWSRSRTWVLALGGALIVAVAAIVAFHVAPGPAPAPVRPAPPPPLSGHPEFVCSRADGDHVAGSHRAWRPTSPSSADRVACDGRRGRARCGRGISRAQSCWVARFSPTSRPGRRSRCHW